MREQPDQKPSAQTKGGGNGNADTKPFQRDGGVMSEQDTPRPLVWLGEQPLGCLGYG